MPEHRSHAGALVLAGVTFAWIFDSIDLMLLALLATDIGISFGHSPSEWLSGVYVVVFGVQLACTAIGGLLFGALGDMLGRKRALVVDILLYACSATMLLFVNDEYQFLAVRALAGIAIGGEWGLGSALLSETYRPEKRGIGTAILQSGWPIGVIIAALISKVAAADPIGAFWWKSAFAVELSSVALAMYIWKYVPESRTFEASKGSSKPISDIFDRPMMRTTARTLTFATLCMFAFYVVWSLIPSELVNEGFLTAEEKFAFIALSGAFGVCGYVLFGILSDKFTRKRTFSFYAMLFASSSIALLFAIGNPIAILFSLCATQFACGLFSSFAGLFSEMFPTGMRATGVSFSYNGARGMSGVLQLLGIVALFEGATGLSTLSAASFVSACAILGASAMIWTFPSTEGMRL